MKNVLQDVLKNIEPHQLITVSIRHDYWTLCRPDAVFPLATCIKRNDDPLDMYRTSFLSSNIIDPEITEHYNQYDLDHNLEFNGIKLTIEREILEIEYRDDYIKLITKNAENTQTIYINYDSIDFVKVNTNEADNLLENYNKFQYEITRNNK